MINVVVVIAHKKNSTNAVMPYKVTNSSGKYTNFSYFTM